MDDRQNEKKYSPVFNTVVCGRKQAGLPLLQPFVVKILFTAPEETGRGSDQFSVVIMRY